MAERLAALEAAGRIPMTPSPVKVMAKGSWSVEDPKLTRVMITQKRRQKKIEKFQVAIVVEALDVVEALAPEAKRKDTDDDSVDDDLVQQLQLDDHLDDHLPDEPPEQDDNLFSCGVFSSASFASLLGFR